METLAELIKDPEAFNATTSAGWSLLHTAAQHDHDRWVVSGQHACVLVRAFVR